MNKLLLLIILAILIFGGLTARAAYKNVTTIAAGLDGIIAVTEDNVK